MSLKPRPRADYKVIKAPSAGSVIVPRTPYLTPILPKEGTLLSTNYMYGDEISKYPDGIAMGTSKVELSGTATLFNNGQEIKSTTDMNEAFFYVPLALGTCEVRYETKFQYYNYYDKPSSSKNQTISFTIFVTSNTEPLPPWNARTVIERALIIAETLRKGDTPRFHLNAEQAIEFEKIQTPEFQFTQSTLREILQDVGKYIHGEPRLKGNEIYYDMYGSNEMTKLKYKNHANVHNIINIEQFASSLDSSVDNLVNTLGTAGSELVEPYAGGYKTLRTESTYARIEEGNAFISTTFPIRSITKVECGFVDGATPPIDITPYVFEDTDYARMSSYDDMYPESRAFALYYTQGQRNIQGLWFKQEKASGTAFVNYAIVNILRAVSGNGNLSVSDYAKLAFRVTYSPIVTARVQQSKQYLGNFKFPRSLAYNQGQNIVEAQYYGENLKGTIARMGNVTKTVTIISRGLPHIPKIGQLWDEDFYISSVAVEVQPYATKITVGLSQDFNRYSEFVGINSTKRTYEVSEKQAFDSHILYTDYVVFGDSKEDDVPTANRPLFSISFLIRIFTQYESITYGNNPITLVIAQGEDEKGNQHNSVALPVHAMALGNTVALITKYADNYSAGDNAIYKEVGKISGYFQNAVSYCDEHGNMEYLNLSYCQNGTEPKYQIEQDNIAPAFPASPKTGFGVSKVSISTSGRPLWVKKGSTEIPTVSYQINFVTNRKNMIIGSALAKNCPFVSGVKPERAGQLYVLPNRLNKLQPKVDLTGATLIFDYDGQSKQIENQGTNPVAHFKPQTSPVSGQAWAMVDKSTHELLIGCNKNIEPNGEDILDGLCMTAKHKVL